ncbi:MAG: alginate export family protein [Acidobacteria bacterium]|nr:alginate export family protein [Acidobacteriota bacterium]
MTFEPPYKRPCLLFLLLFLFPAAPAFAQRDRGTKTPSWLHLSFEQRTRYEHLTNSFRPNISGTEKHFPLRTRLRTEIGEAGRPARFLIELQDSRTLYEKENLFSARANINELDLLQGQLQFNLDNLPLRGIKSRIVLGRFTMDLGHRRLVARNNMRNTTNAFDGVSWTLAGDWDWEIRMFLTRPVTIDPYRPDSGSRRYLWGAYLESARFHRLMLDAYYLGFHDTENPASRQRHSTVGGRLYRMPAPGTMDYEMESAWQFGKNGTQDHFAHFQHGELGFSFNLTWEPRLSVQYDYASGDGSPEDGRSGRFDSLYGARSFEYPPTGIYGPIYRSNITAPGIRIEANPAGNLRIATAYRALRLASARDAWAGSGFQDSTGRAGKYLGQNLEVRLQWQANRIVSLESGYARFFKGSYPELVPGSPDPEDSHYFYIATELKAGLLPH